MKKAKKTRNKLTEKQKAFCVYYCKNGWNGTQAAISAGYSECTAKEMASENLTKPNIQAEVSRLKGNIEEVCQISKAMIVQEHRKLAFSSIAHLHDTWIERKAFGQLTDDQKSCISEISTQTRKMLVGDGVVEVEFIKIKLFDKQKALDSITKIMGYDAPVKAELSGVIDIHQITGLKVG